MAFPSGWARKCAVTIDNTLCGASDSTNFTALLVAANLPDEMRSPTDSNRAQSDGGDIRFSSDSDGNTQLALHVELWEHDTTDAAGDADIALNVKVPTLDVSADTVIYAWYNTTGTTSQPAADDTYGAQNAYDTDHCHVWPLNEAPGDTPPEYKDVVGGRDAAETGGTATSVTGKVGSAFDGGAAAIAFGDYAGFLAPDNVSGDPCTNTGLCFIPKNGYLAVTNFDDEEIIIVNPATGAEVDSFALTQSEAAVQGLAYDSVADQFIVAQNASATNTVYDYDGTYDRTLAAGTNSVAYDFADDAVWCRDAGSGDIEQINKTTGAQITSITFTGDAAGITIDGITHNNTDDTLFVTTDTGDIIYEINKSTGATIRSFRGPFDIEHPAYDHTNDVLYCNGDGRFHSPGELGESAIYKLDPAGGPYDWRAPTTEYTLEFWIKPDSIAGTTVPFANWAAVKPNAFYQEIQCRSGTLRAYDTSVAFVDSAAALSNGTWTHVVVRYEDSSSELKTFIDASNTATKTSAACDIGPDGRLGIGGRPNDTLNHNGAIDDVRLHRVARSASWITARYNNSDDPAAFASAGTPAEGEPGGFQAAWALGATQTIVNGNAQ